MIRLFLIFFVVILSISTPSEADTQTTINQMLAAFPTHTPTDTREVYYN